MDPGDLHLSPGVRLFQEFKSFQNFKDSHGSNGHDIAGLPGKWP